MHYTIDDDTRLTLRDLLALGRGRRTGTLVLTPRQYDELRREVGAREWYEGIAPDGQSRVGPFVIEVAERLSRRGINVDFGRYAVATDGRVVPSDLMSTLLGRMRGAYAAPVQSSHTTWGS